MTDPIDPVLADIINAIKKLPKEFLADSVIELLLAVDKAETPIHIMRATKNILHKLIEEAGKQYDN